MNKLCLKLFLFILPLLFVVIAAEFLLRNIPNNYAYKKEYLDKNAGQIHTFILGNSHIVYGLNPEYFKKNTFNAANVAQSFDYDLLIYKKYADKLSHLEYLILPMSYFSLFLDLEDKDSPEAWRKKNYVIYKDGINLSTFKLLDHRPIVGIKRIYTYYVKKQSEISCSPSGWEINVASENNTANGPKAAKRHTKDIYSEKTQAIFEKNLTNLNTLIELCRAHQVKVILLSTPTFETYHRNLNEEQLNLSIRTAKELTKKYDNVIYVNWQDDTTNFGMADFMDSDHLNSEGAKKLSLMVDEIINAE
jgi:hypothetical protein